MKILSLSTAALTASIAVAQQAPNTPSDHLSRFIGGLDVEARVNADFQTYQVSGRPVTGIALGTTSCNPGSVVGRWFAAPNPDHPLICQLYTKLKDGRFEQVSDWSYVKHSFASTNSNGCGYPQGCINPGSGSLLGLNCSDTYGSGLNASRTYLGPPSEINPWTGGWVMRGSHIDVGYPPTAPDGRRSNVNAVDSLQFRPKIDNTFIGDNSAEYYGSTFYCVQWEPEDVRENNMSTRQINLSTSGASSIGGRDIGPIMDAYTGARVTSAANMVNGVAHDGRFYIGANVTQNNDGTWHYEYAIHNRDNHGGNAEIRIPICSTGTFSNAGFKDVDLDSSNDWTVQRIGDELVWSAPLGNEQKWNTIYNVWFDTPAGPGNADMTIVQAQMNPGAAGMITVPTDAPTLNTNFDLGGGCGNNITMSANGRATVPAPGLAMIARNVPAASLAALHINFNGASVALTPPLGQAGCDLLQPVIVSSTLGIAGIAFWQLPIPNDPGLEGGDLYLQAAIGTPNGAVLGLADLSNQVRLRVGSNITGCN